MPSLLPRVLIVSAGRHRVVGGLRRQLAAAAESPMLAPVPHDDDDDQLDGELAMRSQSSSTC